MNKYLTRTLVFVGLFGVTTGISIAITHEVNKNHETSESEPFKQTDTQQFISKLTTFGNLQGTVDLNATIKDFELSAKGDIFVSLEKLDELAVKTNLNVEMLSSTYPVTITYIDSSLYFDYDELHIKVKDGDFTLIIDALKEIGIEFEIPKEFKNIKTSELLKNLSNMTSRLDGNQIIYTCNLVEGLSPVIFTSDLEHQLTGVSVHELKTETFIASLDGKTTVLGKGHNKITNPEKGGQEYIDIGEYLK